MKERFQWSTCPHARQAGRNPGSLVHTGIRLFAGAVFALSLHQTARADEDRTADANGPDNHQIQAVAPMIDVSPTDFPGLTLGSEDTDSVVVTISNLGDAVLTYNMSVTNDDGGGAHVQINGAPVYGSAIPPLGPPELVTIAYDALGLADGTSLNWRVEVTSNDPANDPGEGGVPIDINLQLAVNDPGACALCGDVNQSGILDAADLVYLTSYLFREGPPPPDPTCADLDGYLLPTLRDLLYLADFLFSGGPPPICPPDNPPCPPMPGGQFQLTYDHVFPPNRSTDTIFINLVNLIGVRGLVIPLQIRVGGAVPAIGDVQLFDAGGWANPSALVNPTGAPDGSVLMAFSTPSGSVPPGDRLIVAIEVSVPAIPSGRLIDLDIGSPFPPPGATQNVNYAVALDDDPALNCWEIELAPRAAAVVDCGMSFSDPCLIACPAGDQDFSVYLRDAAGAPVVGSEDVWLDFSGCPSVVPCPGETDWPLVRPAGLSAASGRAVFLVNAGGCDGGCLVQVMSSCGPIGMVPFRSFDTDGDLAVSPLDYDGGACSDFDCSGELKDADLFAFTSHMGHDCNPDINTLIRPQISVSPDTGAAFGDAIEITVQIRNQTASNVTIDSVVIYTSSFDFNDAQIPIPMQPAPVNSALDVGEATTVTATYVVSPFARAWPAAARAIECVTAEVYTSATAGPSVAELCERVIRQACTPDTMFGFRYFVPEVPAHYYPFILMPTGFSAVVDPNVYTLFTEADSVTAEVSIDPPTATLGDSGTVIMLFCEEEYCGTQIAERRFRAIYAHQRGDVNDDCRITSADIIWLVAYVFKSGPDPLPYEEIGNIDCLGQINSADIITLVNFVFKGADPLLGDCP